MNLHKRDGVLLGTGGLAAVFFLLVPAPLIQRLVLSVLVFFVFMALVVMRFGPDKVPLETWLQRRWRYQRSRRHYSAMPPVREREPKPARPVEKPAAPATVRRPAPSPAAAQPASWPRPAQPEAQPVEPVWAEPLPSPALLPIRVDLEDGRGAWVLNVLMVVIAIYFVYWLATGGAEQLGQFIAHGGDLWKSC